MASALYDGVPPTKNINAEINQLERRLRVLKRLLKLAEERDELAKATPAKDES